MAASSPQAAAPEAGMDDGPSGTGRCEQVPSVRPVPDLFHRGSGFFRDIGYVSGVEALAGHRCRLHRERLGRPKLLTTYVGHGNRTLLDRPDRPPRFPVKEKQEALLRRLDHCVERPAILRHADQRRLRGQIVVPDVVVHRLEMPDALPGRGIECEHAVSKQIGPDAVAPVEVERRRADARENDAALHVEAHAGPVVCPADVLVGVGRPGLVSELARPGRGVEDPAPPAGHCVVGSDMSRCLRIRPLPASSAYDNKVLERHDRARALHGNARHFAVQIFVEVDHSVPTERFVRIAGRGIQAVEAVLDRAEDPSFRSVLGLPVADPAADSSAAPGGGLVERIKCPKEFPRSCLEGLDLDPSSRDVHNAVHNDRRAFDRGLGPLHRVACPVDPGRPQPRDVRPDDPVGCRKAAGTGRAAVVTPLAVRVVREPLARPGDRPSARRSDDCATSRLDEGSPIAGHAVYL